LSRPHETDPQPSREVIAAFFPYGSIGKRLGRAARSTASELSPEQIPPSRDIRRRWTKADYRAFSGAFLVDSHARNLTMSEDVPLERRPLIYAPVRSAIAIFREAMPFAEAERRWMEETFRALPRPLGRNYINPERVQTIDAIEGEIVSAGLRQIASGQDLTRRWWSWRRDADEFADQGGRDIAVKALGELAAILIPNEDEAVAAGIPRVYIPPQR
jgi:hypothetical protein